MVTSSFFMPSLERGRMRSDKVRFNWENSDSDRAFA